MKLNYQVVKCNLLLPNAMSVSFLIDKHLFLLLNYVHFDSKCQLRSNIYTPTLKISSVLINKNSIIFHIQKKINQRNPPAGLSVPNAHTFPAHFFKYSKTPVAQSSGPFTGARTGPLRQGRPTFFVSFLGPNLNLLLRSQNYDAPNNLGQPCVFFGARKFSVSSVLSGAAINALKFLQIDGLFSSFDRIENFLQTSLSISILLSLIVLFFAYQTLLDNARKCEKFIFRLIHIHFNYIFSIISTNNLCL